MGKIDNAHGMADVYSLSWTEMSGSEALGFWRYANGASQNTMFKNKKFWPAFIAYCAIQDREWAKATAYVLENHLDVTLCDYMDDNEIIQLFPEREDYLIELSATSLVAAILASEHPEKSDWLWKELRSYNGWFAEQCYLLLPDHLKSRAFRPVKGETSEATRNAIAVLKKDTATTKEVFGACGKLRWSEVIALASFVESVPRVKTLFAIMNDNQLFGEVWLDLQYSIVDQYDARQKQILGRLGDQKQFNDFVNELNCKGEIK
jgi:hypothetical protein